MLSKTSSVGIFKRGMRRSVHQITRDRSWGATLVLLTTVMVLVHLFLVFLLGVHGISTILTARAGIQVEILPEARHQDIQDLYTELKANPLVEQVAYVTGDQVYKQYQASDPELVSFLEEYKLQNPFPDTFSVRLASLDTYDSFIQQLQHERWKTVVNPSFVSNANSQEHEVRSLLQVTNGLRTLSLLFIVVAIAILFFVVLEWVTRNVARRGQEALLEHLLGAPSLAVLLPFFFEMAILLIGGTVCATLIVGVFLVVLPSFMPAFALEAPFQLLQQALYPLLVVYVPYLVLGEVIILPLLAFIGTVFGVHKRMPASFALLS